MPLSGAGFYGAHYGSCYIKGMCNCGVSAWLLVCLVIARLSAMGKQQRSGFCGVSLLACLLVSCAGAQTSMSQSEAGSAAGDNSSANVVVQTAAPVQLMQSDGAIGDQVEREGCSFAVREIVNPVVAQPGDLATPGKWPSPARFYIGVNVVVASRQGACKATVTIPTASARLFGGDGSVYSPKIGGLMRSEDYAGLTLDPGQPGQDNMGMIYFEVPAGFTPAVLQWNFLSPPIVIQIDLKN